MQGSAMKGKPEGNARVVAHNRKARFNYAIGETFAAGTALTGTGGRAQRPGQANRPDHVPDSPGRENVPASAHIPSVLPGGPGQPAPTPTPNPPLHCPAAL